MAAAAFGAGAGALAAGGGRDGRRHVEQRSDGGELVGGVGVAEAAKVRVDARQPVLGEGEQVEVCERIDDLVTAAGEGRFRSGKAGLAAVGGREWLLEASDLGEDGVVVTEGADDALDHSRPQERGVAGGSEADRGSGHNEPGREAREGATLGLAVLDEGCGDGGVHGRQGLARGGDKHELVDSGREGVPHPLEEGPSTEACGGLVGAKAATQPARDDDAGDGSGRAVGHALRVRERASL